MQNLKAKFKNYGFWVSLIGAIIMFLQSIGIDIAGDTNEIVSGICSILVVLGIVSNPNSGKGFIDKIDDKKPPTPVENQQDGNINIKLPENTGNEKNIINITNEVVDNNNESTLVENKSIDTQKSSKNNEVK